MLIQTLKRKLVRIKKEKVLIPVIEGSYLSGRYALITGGSSGIGYSVAKSFLKNGASVIITGRDNKKLIEASQRLCDEAKVDKNLVKYAILDISNIKTLNNTLSSIIDSSGWQIDIFVNNAGVNVGNNFPDTTEDDYDAVLDTNLKGMYFVSQFFAKYMVRNGIKGNILNITSSSALRPAISPYIISKWGERGLTLGMAKKYLKYDIIINGLAPGSTLTPMLRDESVDEDLQLDYSPAKRFLVPEEVANIATILVSSVGRMIIGDTIYMTGGSGVITFDDMGY